jgi:hypothetical protein
MKNLPISVKFLAILGMLAVFSIAAVGFVARQMYAISTHAQQVNNTVVLAALICRKPPARWKKSAPPWNICC